MYSQTPLKSNGFPENIPGQVNGQENFNKNSQLFPHKANNLVVLNSAGVSPTYGPAAQTEAKLADIFSKQGSTAFLDETVRAVLTRIRKAGAGLFNVPEQDISYVQNTALAINMLALSYPFQPGDEVLLYRYEYPSNIYPWLSCAALKQIKINYIEGSKFRDRPLKFTLDDVEQAITPRTKIISLSQVQFSSGFLVDVEKLSLLAKKYGVHLILDVAQSAGYLPTAALGGLGKAGAANVDALISPGWKWLLGPVESGIMYTSPEFRSKLQPAILGPDMMEQCEDYLDHRVQPYKDGRMFHYSTLSRSLAGSLAVSIEENILRYSSTAIWNELLRLQKLLLENLNLDLLELAPLAPLERGGILSFIPKVDECELNKRLQKQGIICAARAGYFRLAPHYYLEDQEILRAAEIINKTIEQVVSA